MSRPVNAHTPSPSRAVALALAVAVVLLAAAPAAHADRKWPKHARYEPRAQAAEYGYARVLDVQPIVTRVRVEEPRRECWEEARYEEPRPRPGAGGSMVLGGLLGGAIGSQIGRGDGRRAATVAGAIIGTAIGHEVGERRRAGYQEAEPRAYTVQQCDTRYESRWDERVAGYDVVYEYRGRRYDTRLPYDPGRQLRVRFDVAPAEG